VRKHVGVLDFVPQVTPRLSAPVHLRPFAEAIERVGRGEQEVMVTVATPPRHGKTIFVWHSIAWLLRLNPALRIVYVTYGQQIGEKKSRLGRGIAERAKVRLDPSAASLHDWRTTTEEGGVWVTSVGGPLTGEGFDVAFFDDLIKSRAEAESAVIRDRVHEYVLDIMGRGEPGASLFYVAHRWHVDDPEERLIASGTGWERIVLPAIDGEGRALWPERYTVEQLRGIESRIGAYAFASLFQGAPYSRGGTVFSGGTVFYVEMPAAFQITIGLDFAYVAKTRADRSVAVVVAIGPDGVLYVLDVIVRQCDAPTFASVLVGLRQKYPGARFASYIGGTERGTIDFMRRAGVEVHAMAAREDKFSRSQLTAASWNAGRIRLPREAPWLDAAVSEVIGFTGVGDRHDDIVDALVSAHDARLPPARSQGWVHTLRAYQASGGANGQALRLGLSIGDMHDAALLRAIARTGRR
jgi:predicted phage terminase large subunit-like protein